MTLIPGGSADAARLVEENRLLREEVKAARRASEITAELVVQQFVDTDRMLDRLKEKAATETRLRRQLAAELREAERRERELAEERARLEAMRLAQERMMAEIIAAHDAAEAANRELAAANAKLQRAMERAGRLADEATLAAATKSEFLANMSHEIRTPINAVIGLATVLLDAAVEGEQREHLGIIKASADTLLAIVNDILDFSKIEAGRQELEELDFDVEQAVRQTAAILSTRAAERGLTIAVAVDPDVPRALRGDPARLRQVLMNLAGNAIKFTPHGEVAVRVHRVVSDRDEAVLRFEVEDYGVGIPHERMHRLFVSFSQVDASTTRRFGGTGLGLAICKELVTLMGGRIGAESEVGRGSVFWFEIPFRRQSQARAAAAGAEAGDGLAPLPAKRILVVEDNAANRMVTLAVLAKLGLVGEAVANGLEAVNALAVGDYDLVLMDVQMPVMDGFEATDTIRDPSSKVVNHDVPVVAMTAHAISGFRERCLAHGMNDYVAKPVSHAALHRVLARHLLGTTVDDAPHATAVAAGDPIFDWRGLLDRVGGNVALGRSVIEQFLEDTPGYALEVVASLRAGDWPTVARQAHRLKGTSATVGADRLQTLVVTIEHQAASGAVADPAATERQLLAAIDDVLARMRETLAASAETLP